MLANSALGERRALSAAGQHAADKFFDIAFGPAAVQKNANVYCPQRRVTLRISVIAQIKARQYVDETPALSSTAGRGRPRRDVVLPR